MVNKTEAFSLDSLSIVCEEESKRIETMVRDAVFKKMRKKGVVIGLSGGIDSTVCAAICVKALGKERVLGILMPELDSADDTNDLGYLAADDLGIETVFEDITPILNGAGCYKRRNDAIRMILPEYEDDWKSKVIIPSILDSNRLNVSYLVAVSPTGEEFNVRVTLKSYLKIVAASNFKQRTRKMIEYYHADRLNYAVIGTPNRLEYELGFFVKNGDGAADIKPIAHLYKTQVYQLADYYQVPEQIRNRPPTTDTYSLPQSQEEFYFSLPYDKMDASLYGKNHQIPISEVGNAIGLSDEQMERVYEDINSKLRATKYLHMPPKIFGKIYSLHE